MRLPVFAAMLAVVSCLAAQDENARLRASVVAVSTASEERCAALLALQAANALDEPTVLAALGGADEALARTAAAIVRQQWLELPSSLFDGLSDDVAAARVLLHELALAPRPAATAWIERWLEAPSRTVDDRCLALAAHGAGLSATQAQLLAQLLIEALAGDDGGGWRAAVHVLPAKTADAMLGRLHAGLMQGRFDVDRAGPLLDRMSDEGVRRLLALVVTLPGTAAQALCARVHERVPALVDERVASALDHDAKVDLTWLRYASPQLDRPSRIARVQSIMVDAAADGEVREAAFRALAEAKVIDAPVLDFAVADDDRRVERVRRVLNASIDQLPADRLLRWLADDPQLAKLVVQQLPARSVLGPALERHLVNEILGTGSVDGTFCRPATLTILRNGGPESLQFLWPLLRASSGWPEFLDVLVRRREPFVPELLLGELMATPEGIGEAERRGQLDEVALALIALGDRRELERLVHDAHRSSATFVRRCAHRVQPLSATCARQLLGEAVGSESIDADVAIEMVAWAASAVADPEVSAQLCRWWREPPPVAFAEELREVAMRALVASSQRSQLVGEMREAMLVGPLPEPLESIAFEVVATMPTPLTADDLALCADLVLLRPRTDPEREARLAERWPEGTSGFPLVGAVAQRLRGQDPTTVGAAFAAATEQALADPRHTGIAPMRLFVLARALVIDPAVQLAVGKATAPLALRIGTAETRPVAAWFAMHAADEALDLVAARTWAAAALPLVINPAQRGHARVLLGERDPGSGRDPWAALAAMPYRFEYRAALLRGDAVAAELAFARVREFAGHDRATLHLMPGTSVESIK